MRSFLYVISVAKVTNSYCPTVLPLPPYLHHLSVNFHNVHNTVAIAEYTVSVSSGGHVARTEGADVVDMPHQLVVGERGHHVIHT